MNRILLETTHFMIFNILLTLSLLLQFHSNMLNASDTQQWPRTNYTTKNATNVNIINGNNAQRRFASCKQNEKPEISKNLKKYFREKSLPEVSSNLWVKTTFNNKINDSQPMQSPKPETNPIQNQNYADALKNTAAKKHPVFGQYVPGREDYPSLKSNTTQKQTKKPTKLILNDPIYAAIDRHQQEIQQALHTYEEQLYPATTPAFKTTKKLLKILNKNNVEYIRKQQANKPSLSISPQSVIILPASPYPKAQYEFNRAVGKNWQTRSDF